MLSSGRTLFKQAITPVPFCIKFVFDRPNDLSYIFFLPAIVHWMFVSICKITNKISIYCYSNAIITKSHGGNLSDGAFLDMLFVNNPSIFVVEQIFSNDYKQANYICRCCTK